MKERIEKMLKSNLKRKLTITISTLIAFLLSSNLAMAKQTYQVGNNKIERDNSGTWEGATEKLKNTGLFKIQGGDILNKLKDYSDFTLLVEVNKNFINEGSIFQLINNGTGKIENLGTIWDLTSTTASEIENRGYINDFASEGNIANKAFISEIKKAKNIVNNGAIERLLENEKTINNGIIGRIPNGTHIADIEKIENNGIINFSDDADYTNITSGTSRLANKGIVLTEGNFKVMASDPSIKNYHNENITDIIINNQRVNAYEGNIVNNLEVKNNSILNMFDGTIAADKKISIDNSTANIENVEYNNGLQLEIKNNSKIGGLGLDSNNINDKIKNLTIDNTVEVGIVYIVGNIDEINLVPNTDIANKDKVLRINGFRTIAKANVNTNISTNVDLLERTDFPISSLGNITVKDGGRLTIAKDALRNNGDDGSGQFYKKDIKIEGNGKILIGIDPYNIGVEEELGEGNNLTDSVKGQKDTMNASERLAQSSLNIDADSLLHDIVILPKYSVTYQDVGAQEVRNKYKVVEAFELPTPPTPPSGSGATPPDYTYLNDVYGSLQKAGKVKDFSVYNNDELLGLYAYLRDIYANSPYALSAETSFRNLDMLRDNAYLDLKPNLNNWAVMGGLNHSDKENKYKLSTTEVDIKTTGAYAKGEYGLSESVNIGLILGGTNSKTTLSTAKIKGSSIYLGMYARKYVNNFKFTLGTGLDLSEYKVDREAIGYAGIIETSKHSAIQINKALDLYAEMRYSKDLGNNFYLEPNFNLAYSRVKQNGVTENNGKVNLDIKSKTFNQTTAEIGLDLKKVLLSGNISHSFAIGTSYKRVLSGAKENTLRASVIGGSEFDILVPAKEKGRVGLGVEYRLESKVGILFNLKMDYGFSHGSDKKDIRISTGLGYRF